MKFQPITVTSELSKDILDNSKCNKLTLIYATVTKMMSQIINKMSDMDNPDKLIIIVKVSDDCVEVEEGEEWKNDSP